jgi:hypothetical protein
MAQASTMVYASGESMRSILAVLPVGPSECIRIHAGIFTDVAGGSTTKGLGISAQAKKLRTIIALIYRAIRTF